jgi:oligoribonuclease NrnB/cAMP/cGMP phosphodiesterase (DHH superfamily)
MKVNVMEIVFYHGPYCADGLASRWVAHMKWPNAHFVPFGSQDVLTTDQKELCRSKSVLFVDVSPTLHDTIWLHQNCSLTIFDHHYSTLQMLKFSGMISKVKVVLSQNMCGCHIIWSQCFPGQPLPWVLRYIQSRDLWTFKNKNEQIISWIISSNVISTFQSQGIQQTYNYMDSLLNSKGWLWNATHSDRWSVYQTKLRRILQNNVRNAMLSTPNQMLINVRLVQTKYLWMASDMMEILKSQKHDGLFMFVHSNKETKTSVVTLRGMSALVVAQQWPGGGGHLMAAGFKTSTTDLNARIYTQTQH